MSISDLFSKRGKKPPTKLAYDAIPDKLRAQIVAIVRDTLSRFPAYMALVDRVLEKEHALPTFRREPQDMYGERHTPYAIECLCKGTFDEYIDAIEALFVVINTDLRNLDRYHPAGSSQDPDDAIDELNGRFLEHGVGYQFSKDENRIVRVDSKLLHQVAVEPAMRLLAAPGFEGPANEFADAHQHHRAGNAKDALTAAVRALESTAKAICDARKWRYDKNKATLKPLLDILFQNGLVPAELESHFTNLRAALESGLPTLANRMARHGQGSKVKDVPDHLVAFGMHLCAAAIVLLVAAHRAKK